MAENERVMYAVAYLAAWKMNLPETCLSLCLKCPEVITATCWLRVGCSYTLRT